MAHLSPVPLNFQDAHTAADINGIIIDLDWILKTCDVLKRIPCDMVNINLLEAISAGIIIKYGKCDKEGVRKRIPRTIIGKLPKKAQKTHNFFVNLRDKYIAHSVNAFEEDWAVAYIDQKNSKNQRFHSIGFHHEHIIAILGAKDIERLVYLIKRLKESLSKMLNKSKKNIKKIASRIPIVELVKYDFPNRIKANDIDLEKARKRKIEINP